MGPNSIPIAHAVSPPAIGHRLIRQRNSAEDETGQHNTADRPSKESKRPLLVHESSLRRESRGLLIDPGPPPQLKAATLTDDFLVFR
jgi:hypothetical protein